MTVVDPEVLGQLAQDTSLADVRHIAGVFAQDVARLLPEAARCAEAADATGWRRALHSLAGASGALGAVGLEAAARAAIAQPGGPGPGWNNTLPSLEALGGRTLRELVACIARLETAA